MPGSVKPPLNRSHGRNRGMVPTNIANETEVVYYNRAITRLKEILGITNLRFMKVLVWQPKWQCGNKRWDWVWVVLELVLKRLTHLLEINLIMTKQQDALTQAAALEALQFGRARDARVTSGLENYYGGGQGTFNQGFDKLLGMITDQGKVSQQGVTDAYGRAITNGVMRVMMLLLVWVQLVLMR
jgi:hypothetical protein